MNPVILVMGLPASGKSTITKALSDAGYHVLNRDSAGGSVSGLLADFNALVIGGADVVVDNLHLTVEGRAPFVEAARRAGRSIECHWMQTSFEDAQFNACSRMFGRYGEVFLTAPDIRAHAEAKKDPNVFPIAAMFHAKKRLAGDKKQDIPSGKPTMAEGFSRIVKVPFVRRPWEGGIHKALVLDYDGTLRDDARNHGGEFPYPTHPSQVSVLPNVRETLARHVEDGYLLVGITTQSGIGKGVVSRKDVEACIAETNRQLGQVIPVYMCPHHNFPVQCYCRKPQVGLGVLAIRRHGLDPARCVMVGDMKTDLTFADRCGFGFEWAKDFFGW